MDAFLWLMYFYEHPENTSNGDLIGAAFRSHRKTRFSLTSASTQKFSKENTALPHSESFFFLNVFPYRTNIFSNFFFQKTKVSSVVWHPEVIFGHDIIF